MIDGRRPMRAWVRWARRAGIGGAALALVFRAFMGFLHTSAGRPVMARLFGARCPMKSATAEGVDRARRMGVAAERGAASAPARPAFGFRLDRTTRADVRAWARRHQVSCVEPQAWLVQCGDVAPGALGRPDGEGRIEELTFGFRPDGRLVNVSTLRRRLTPAEGNRIASDIAKVLYAELGQPTPSSIGEGRLSDESLSSTRVSLRYSDYFADVTAMNLPTTGVALREQYLSATD